jgi:hypothetical protein
MTSLGEMAWTTSQNVAERVIGAMPFPLVSQEASKTFGIVVPLGKKLELSALPKLSVHEMQNLMPWEFMPLRIGRYLKEETRIMHKHERVVLLQGRINSRQYQSPLYWGSATIKKRGPLI